MNYQTVDILHFSDKQVIARLSRIKWPMFTLYLILYCYLARLKACEISLQNMRNSENIGHTVIGNVRNQCKLLSKEKRSFSKFQFSCQSVKLKVLDFQSSRPFFKQMLHLKPGSIWILY